VGSPVRAAPISADAPFSAQLVWAGLNRRGMESERKARRRCQRNEAHRILLATGSWMGRLSFFDRTGLRFDDTLDLAGGEDWRLY
ncbi:hypothetical protein J8J17_24650, partial [Mycobacterium tuberculosis]|nr:hypothetical protein [Mycobacterium tuberculosis]